MTPVSPSGNNTGFVFMEHLQSEVDALRGIVLLGRNVASYKFALAGAILELAATGATYASLTDLAEPFSRRLCSHLATSPRQTISPSSTYLEICRKFNTGEATHEELILATKRMGFNNVIDAFHVVGSGESRTRFFEDDRKGPRNGISLTDSIFTVAETKALQVSREIEARWRLVETAWDLGINTSLILFDDHTGILTDRDARIAVTSARDALNGYQRGHCFYCFAPISTTSGDDNLADVDHFFPHVLQRIGILGNLNGVWNLVLACQACNRGNGGKFDAIPSLVHVNRLARRNEYLCESHNPLQQTLKSQIGQSTVERNVFLQNVLTESTRFKAGGWSPQPVGPEPF
jgi:5-methylcytosine-specific restriction endonuclease McrA